MLKPYRLEGEGVNLEKLYPSGWILYCPECSDFICQSDPQNFSGKKSVVIDDLPCKKCTDTANEEVKEAQQIMGRLGLPKENQQ
jgi:hypothetical protein